MGDQPDRAHLVEADDHAVLGLGSVERKDALGLRLKVRVWTPLPRARALVGESGADQRLAQRLLGQMDAHTSQVRGQLGQRPARQRDALVVGAGARDRDDALALLGRRLPGAPAPVVRVQRVKPLLVERVNHLAHMRLIASHQTGDLRRRHPSRRRQQDHRPLTLGLVLRLARDLAQPQALLRRELAHEHIRRTHHHLQHRGHASWFATEGEFPVKRLRETH
jgi:hypothetical protein